MDYNICKSKAEEISKIIFEKLNNSETEFHRKFFIEYPDIQKLCTKEPEFVLVLGLNPSSSGEGKNSNPNIFGHIPLKELNRPVEEVREITSKIAKKKLVYDPYFKTLVAEFEKLGYHPLWYNKAYLKGLLDDHKNLLDDSEQKFIKLYSKFDNKKYIIYAELIHYSETNSKKILPLLELDEISSRINEYIKLLIEYFMPKAILSANAAVSHYLNSHFNNNRLCSDFILSESKVFLGSMLTGRRAMDIYSRIRLMNDLRAYLNNKEKQI